MQKLSSVGKFHGADSSSAFSRQVVSQIAMAQTYVRIV